MKEVKEPRFNDAFQKLSALKKQLEEKETKVPPPAAVVKAATAPKKDDDATAFLRAMSGVKKLGDDGRGERVRVKAETAPVRVEDDSDALIDLASSIDVGSRLENEEEGRVAFSKGLDIKIVKRLQRGEFPVDDQLDLHGMRKADAEFALGKFLKKSRAAKTRCVLVVTGKGLHSDAGPVLADAVRRALGKTYVAHVLAYSVARPEHGGDGALYVLLRRR